MSREDELVLRTAKGTLAVGSAESLRRGMEEVSRLTGGSSGGGRFSYVFGFDGHVRSGHVYPEKELLRLAAEAAELLTTLELHLSNSPATQGARTFLETLAALPDAKPLPRPSDARGSGKPEG